MLVKEIKSKGSVTLNLVMCRYNACNNDTIMRLYFNDWALIQSMPGFGKKRHAELKTILDNMKVKEVRK
jgi:hypothetical protein